MSFEPDALLPIWQKPAFEDISGSLERLRVAPPVWNLKVSRSETQSEPENTPYERREIVSYLSAIIKSSLEWIQSEDEREQLWTEASKRLSERCGRTGERPKDTHSQAGKACIDESSYWGNHPTMAIRKQGLPRI